MALLQYGLKASIFVVTHLINICLVTFVLTCLYHKFGDECPAGMHMV